MARSPVPSGRPVAPGVDPAEHVPEAPAETQPVVLNDEAPVNTKDTSAERALPGNGDTAEVKTVTVRTKVGLLMDPYSARHVDDRAEGTEVPVTTFITEELAEGGRLERV